MTTADTTQETFFDAVYNSAEMKAADKAYWLHITSADYYQQLAQSCARERLLSDASLTHGDTLRRYEADASHWQLRAAALEQQAAQDATRIAALEAQCQAYQKRLCAAQDTLRAARDVCAHFPTTNAQTPREKALTAALEAMDRHP